MQLIYLAFFFFQYHVSVSNHPVGYHVFSPAKFPQDNGTTYLTRSFLALFLFLGPFLWWGSVRLRNAVLALLLVATTLHYGLVVSAIPEWDMANDRSRALRVAGDYLLNGVFPYSPFWGMQPLTPLSTTIGAGFVAHVLFDRPEFASLPFLLFGFLVLAWHRYRIQSFIPWQILAAGLFLNPLLVWDLGLGSDVMWGGILIAAALVFFDGGKLKAASVLFALALCTRASMFLLAPMWGVYLWQGHGRRVFVRCALISGLIVALLEIPIFLWNPHLFLTYAPLGKSSELLQHAPPAGENLLADALSYILPPGGNSRARAATLMLLGLSMVLGCLVRNVGQLARATCAYMMASLMLLGTKFLIDYTTWLLFPLMFTLLGTRRRNEGTDPTTA